MEYPGGALSSTQDGCQEGRLLRITTRPIGRNDSQRPVPNPKAQGCDPLIHWGKPQHETAELGGNKQMILANIVKCITRENKTMQLFYANIKTHIHLLLIPH
ncbi:hypothetical protein GOODEAATRI_031327 [Goodea atripinnis]|uniref:Uncharacterized protein n=1 Tax=Goodea atripinnis TaxID=208336 RepID=A0ABV0P976_9TELE